MAHKRKTVEDLEQKVIERKKKYVRYEEGKTYIHYSVANIRQICYL